MDLEDGLPELKINMDRNRMYELGITAYGAGSELNAAINGMTASRYDDDGTQVDIVVGLADEDKKTFADLEQIYVSSSTGKRIPFASFARYEETLAPVAINRENQTRIIHVTASANPKISISVVQAEVEKVIKENLPLDENVSISYEGSNKELMDALINYKLITESTSDEIIRKIYLELDEIKNSKISVFVEINPISLS